MTYRTLPSAALLAVTLTALTAACETTTYDVDGDAVADAATAPDAGSRKDATAPGATDAALDGATADATPDAEIDGAVLNDAASDGQVPVDGGPIDSGTGDAGSDGGGGTPLATGDLPADASYTYSAIRGTGPYAPGCTFLELGGYPGAESRTCCYGATRVVLRNRAHVVITNGGSACMEAGAVSTCAPVAAGPTGAVAELTSPAELLALVRAWGWPVSIGTIDPASAIKISPAADGTRATVSVRVQTLWGPVMPSKNCMRGLGSWMHETFDVPLVPAP